MTNLTPQETNLLLILGEMRGDLKSIADGLSKMENKVSLIEDATDAKMEKLSVRVAKLEAIALRVGTLTLALGILVSVTQPQWHRLAQLVFGG